MNVVKSGQLTLKPTTQLGIYSDQIDNNPANQAPQLDHQRQGPTRRKARKSAASAMDYEQTIIPSHIYQSWLQRTSDIVSKRGRKRKIYDATSTTKIGNLMELPPVALICGLSTTGKRNTLSSTSFGRKSHPSLRNLLHRHHQIKHIIMIHWDFISKNKHSVLSLIKYLNVKPFEDFHSGLGSQSLGVSREKLRTNLKTNEIPPEVLILGLSNNLGNNGVRVNEANVMVTPGNSGDKVKSIPNSGSGHSFLSNNSNVNSGRSNKKRPYASSRHSWSGLEPVAEENSWQQPDLNFKLARLSENGLTPENDLFVESNQSLIRPSSKKNLQSTH